MPRTGGRPLKNSGRPAARGAVAEAAGAGRTTCPTEPPRLPVLPLNTRGPPYMEPERRLPLGLYRQGSCSPAQNPSGGYRWRLYKQASTLLHGTPSGGYRWELYRQESKKGTGG